MFRSLSLFLAATLVASLVSCSTPKTMKTEGESVRDRVNQYTTVRLTTDLSVLSEKERQMIPLLIEAADLMNQVFWQQAYGNGDSLMTSLKDPDVRRFVEINYGPWDRLADNDPFVAGVGAKPMGANFYPADMTAEEFEKAVATNPALKSNYTMVRRDAAGALQAIPYHEFFKDPIRRASEKLHQAAALAEDPGLRRYLELRAQALLTDEYRQSDFAWMDMKNNTLDLVIGPIETYEDQLFGYKAANEGFVLVKDQEWSKRLARYAALLPTLQRGLPVAEDYKKETPGSDSDLNAYDVIYYAGDANAGSKTIAINLPNDEQVQLARGTRRLQLKNAMQAKFDKILVPIAGVLIAPDQRENVTFDAFFSNVMFHEVAHGLGLANTISGKGTVREALRDQYTTMEEGKADVLGLYMVTSLQRSGELETDLNDNFVTFLAGIFRSIRFGGASAHGRANLVRFNFFKEQGAFTRASDGTYSVNFQKLEQAMNALSERILTLQGNGDYAAVAAFVKQYGQMDGQLKADLARLGTAGIPVDVVFEQGPKVLGIAR